MPQGMSTAEKDDILQWRKLTGDVSSKGTPWRYLKNNQNNRAARQRARNGENVKISRQDLVNAEAKKRRQKQLSGATKKDRVASNSTNNGNKGKLCIVQTKKARYSHLISSQRIMPKQDDDHLPIVYNSERGDDRDRKEVAALWLQPFTVLDDY